jgi:hypothetical protein
VVLLLLNKTTKEKLISWGYIHSLRLQNMKTAPCFSMMKINTPHHLPGPLQRASIWLYPNMKFIEKKCGKPLDTFGKHKQGKN